MKKFAKRLINFGWMCFGAGITMLISMIGFYAWNTYGWVGIAILFSSLLTIIGVGVIIITPFPEED